MLWFKIITGIPSYDSRDKKILLVIFCLHFECYCLKHAFLHFFLAILKHDYLVSLLECAVYSHCVKIKLRGNFFLFLINTLTFVCFRSTNKKYCICVFILRQRIHSQEVIFGQLWSQELTFGAMFANHMQCVSARWFSLHW